MNVEMVRGKKDLIARVGKDAVARAVASTKFPGSPRAIPRGSWHPYVYKVDGGYIVATPDDAQIRKSMWLDVASYEAAQSHVERLTRDALPKPPEPVSVHEWKIEQGATLALDTEGDLDRISLSTETQAASWQWSEPVRQVVQAQLDAASTVLAHYAIHDRSLLALAGLSSDPLKWRCTLVAHVLLNPYRNKGLGYAAPMYFPVEPWKAGLEDDPEMYSLLDAWVLTQMWPVMRDRMDALRLWPVYFQDLKIQEMFHEPLASGGNTRFLPRNKGHEGPVERAAACLESESAYRDAHPKGWLTAQFPDPDGRIACGLRDPYAAAFHYLSGTRLRAVDGSLAEARARILYGRGIDKARKGGDGLAPLLSDFPTRKDLTDALAEDWQVLANWRKTAKRQLARDKHVTNPFGRKWFNGSADQAVRFLTLSTVNDAIRQRIIRTGIRPSHLSFGRVVISPGQAGPFVDSSPLPLEILT